MTTIKSLFVAALLASFAAASFAHGPTPPVGPREHGARHHQAQKHQKHLGHRHHHHRKHRMHEGHGPR